MQPQKQPKKLKPIQVILITAVISTLWFLFAPQQIGGLVLYVLVRGNSMEPLMTNDDLALYRATDSYEVGDVVVYQDPLLGPVMHRIIGREGSRFVMKGDNNRHIDSYQPAHDDVRGELWFFMPRAGKLVLQLRAPAIMALSAGLLGVVLFMRRKSESPARGTAGQAEPRGHGGRGAPATDFLILMLVVGIISLIFGVLAFTRPVETTTLSDLIYTHTGSFTYTADVAASDVYETGIVRTGEPVFRALTQAVRFGFDYTLETPARAAVTIRHRLIAEVGQVNGWLRVVELQPWQESPVSALTLSGTLSLSEVQSLIDTLSVQTGVDRPQYTVSIVPEIEVAGALDGYAINEVFRPSLDFIVDDLQMYLKPGEETLILGRPIQAAASGTITVMNVVPNTLDILGLQIGIRLARTLAVLGFGSAVIGALGYAMLHLLAIQGGEPRRIRFLYGSYLVNISQNGIIQSGKPIVEVTAFEDLVRLAESGTGAILYECEHGMHRYVVQAQQVTYLYQVPE